MQSASCNTLAAYNRRLSGPLPVNACAATMPAPALRVHAPGSHTPVQVAARVERMARMPSTLCRCTAATGPFTGNAVLESRPHSCSKRLQRSTLRAGTRLGGAGQDPGGGG